MAAEATSLTSWLALDEYLVDYGKPLTVEFVAGGKKFVCNDVMKTVHVGAKDIFKRIKADIHLVTSKLTVYPISVKANDAGAWESADTYWGEASKQFLMWALDKKHTMLEDNKAGGYSVKPPIAIAASAAEQKDVVFGSDILGKGAVVQQTFDATDFKWDFKRDVVTVECKAIITTEGEVTGAHTAYFQIRNDKTRDRSSYTLGSDHCNHEEPSARCQTL